MYMFLYILDYITIKYKYSIFFIITYIIFIFIKINILYKMEFINNTLDTTIPINSEKQYNGSNICIASSHLFLFASIFNYYHNNIVECFSIFSLYISSIIYHYNGENHLNIFNMFNLDYKLLDVYCCRIVISICIRHILK